MLQLPWLEQVAEEPVRIKALIRFKGGYRYQLIEGYSAQTEIRAERDIVTPYIRLNSDGYLMIAPGYCWDGASGPALDTRAVMRGSLIHDALYQLMRMEHLPQVFRGQADREFYSACIDDGMGRFRAQYLYRAVRLFGRSSTEPEARHQILEAP